MIKDAPKAADFSLYFKDEVAEKFKLNPNLFDDLKKNLTANYIKTINGVRTIEYNDCKVIDAALVANIQVMFDIMYELQQSGSEITFLGLEEIDEKLAAAVLDFLNFAGPIIHAAHDLHAQRVKTLNIALDNLKQAILAKNFKVSSIISEWLTKWSTYLQKEDSVTPFNARQIYHQGDIVLADYGFRVGSEVGGRHYAVVVELDNNPINPVVLLTPISSLKPGKKVHPTNVDLGKLINNKPSFAVIDQIGAVSKIRIEKHLGSRNRLPQNLLDEILLKTKNKLNIK